MSQCEWCKGIDTDYPDTETLCLTHEAEWEGTTVDMLLRREEIQAAEWADMMPDFPHTMV